MAVKFRTAIEIEVEVRGSVDFPVQPHGWDPGDPGGCELEAVVLEHKRTNRQGETETFVVDILECLPDGLVKELEEQLQGAAEEQAMDAYNASMEAKYDATKEGE